MTVEEIPDRLGRKNVRNFRVRFGEPAPASAAASAPAVPRMGDKLPGDDALTLKRIVSQPFDPNDRTPEGKTADWLVECHYEPGPRVRRFDVTP